MIIYYIKYLQNVKKHMKIVLNCKITCVFL